MTSTKEVAAQDQLTINSCNMPNDAYNNSTREGINLPVNEQDCYNSVNDMKNMPGAVALQPAPTAVPPMVSPEQYDLLKKKFCPGCTETEFRMFVFYVNTYRLDPFLRQIWAIKYGNKPVQIFVGRDGLLAVAHRSGQFDGMSDPEYTYDENGKVSSVRVRVYRKDMSHPFTGDAFMVDDNKHQSVWNERPRIMLLKVAESRALRKAFEISGLYTPEEMGEENDYFDAEVVEPQLEAPSTPELVVEEKKVKPRVVLF